MPEQGAAYPLTGADSCFPALYANEFQGQKNRLIYKLTLTIPNSITNNADFLAWSIGKDREGNHIHLKPQCAFARSNRETAGVVCSLNEMSITTERGRERERETERGKSINFPPSFIITWLGHGSQVSDLEQISWGSPPAACFLWHVSKVAASMTKPPNPTSYPAGAKVMLGIESGRVCVYGGVGVKAAGTPMHTAGMVAGDDTIHQLGHRLSEREWGFVMNE